MTSFCVQGGRGGQKGPKTCVHTNSILPNLNLGPKKYQKIARMYDRTGLSTKCTLIKTGFKNLRTGTKANFRPFVDALMERAK